MDKNLGNISTLVGVGAALGGVDLSNVVFATELPELNPWNRDRKTALPGLCGCYERIPAYCVTIESLKEKNRAWLLYRSGSATDRTVPVNVYNTTGGWSLGYDRFGD